MPPPPTSAGSSGAARSTSGAFQSQGFTPHPRRRQHPARGHPGGQAVRRPDGESPSRPTTPASSSNPVDGGVITFTAPTSGASASLSATTATVSGGRAGASRPRPRHDRRLLHCRCRGCGRRDSGQLRAATQHRRGHAETGGAARYSPPWRAGRSLTWCWPPSPTPPPARAPAISAPRSSGVTASRR